MTVELPQSARIFVPPELANQLLEAAVRLPEYDNQEFYDPGVQANVFEGIRQGSVEGFDWLVNQIRQRIEQRPYCVVVTGLKFDEGNRLFVGLNRSFGELVARPYEKPRAQLVHYIQPATDRLATGKSRYETEKLHTDTADWDIPVELISMVCVRADHEGGGRSQILDIEALREEVLMRLGVETLRLIETEPLPWLMAPYRGGGVNWRPVLLPSSICWRRYTIDLALNSAAAEVPEKTLATLDAFEDVINSAAGTIEFLMSDGELLFTDNHRTIHARTPIPSGEASDRLMIRSWIKTRAS